MIPKSMKLSNKDGECLKCSRYFSCPSGERARGIRCKDFERFRKEDKHGMGRCKRVGRDPVGGNDCGRSNDSVPVSSDPATGIKKSTRIFDVVQLLAEVGARNTEENNDSK